MKSGNIHSLLKMTWMEAKLFLRDPASAFFSLVFPLIYLFMYGMISGGNEPTPMYAGRGTIDAAIPSLTAVIISMTGLMSITITLTTYREKGILRRLRTTPVSPLVILTAQVIVIFAMTCLGMLLLIATGKLVYHVRFEGNALSVLGGFILGSLGFFGIGFILASSMSTVRSAWVVAMVLLYPMLFLSGAFFAVELLPAAVQKVSAFLPLTYVVNLLQGLWIGDAWSSHLLDVGVLVALLVVGVFVSAKTFRWE
jgi:ABC-2 type transport system permease protein